MDPRPLTQQQRSALLQFEVLHGKWRHAVHAWSLAELRLWSEALRGADTQELRRLGAEAARLRGAARAAYLDVVDALRHGMPD